MRDDSRDERYDFTDKDFRFRKIIDAAYWTFDENEELVNLAMDANSKVRIECQDLFYNNGLIKTKSYLRYWNEIIKRMYTADKKKLLKYYSSNN
tara:strand:+ start:69 stop:350 length:282 start_codon:yes stop_codon:yes gene_type:complete